MVGVSRNYATQPGERALNQRDGLKEAVRAVVLESLVSSPGVSSKNVHAL